MSPCSVFRDRSHAQQDSTATYNTPLAFQKTLCRGYLAARLAPSARIVIDSFKPASHFNARRNRMRPFLKMSIRIAFSIAVRLHFHSIDFLSTNDSGNERRSKQSSNSSGVDGSHEGASPVIPAICPITARGDPKRAISRSSSASLSLLERRLPSCAVIRGTWAYCGCGSPRSSCR